MSDIVFDISPAAQQLASSASKEALSLKLLKVIFDATVDRYLRVFLAYFLFAADLGFD